jgi:hypothetical protein
MTIERDNRKTPAAVFYTRRHENGRHCVLAISTGNPYVIGSRACADPQCRQALAEAVISDHRGA